ncbi:c-type cytochrome [Alisedimentitalea sp. MJ-SS2]|uniref:c-type cytochrome n=1 Tax=Aliisedimentitalea sp. MJ-SS2 TaxID=3049795 RepID=UPI0029079C29|nr:c-type cytochrome [Alisedimentitalea sp. MJ-SS2]MDU8929497.1 c-type cytochrome [Alisedimentitalea sp. MJ-SS2]
MTKGLPMRRNTILLAIGVCAVFGAIGLFALHMSSTSVRASGLMPYQDARAIELGKTLYEEYCASCHSTNLEGEPNWRDRDDDGYLPAPPHDPSGHTWHHPDQQLFMITKYGTEKMVGDGYKSRMIGFKDSLSDTEILSALAYIKSTWPPGIIARHNKINGN